MSSTPQAAGHDPPVAAVAVALAHFSACVAAGLEAVLELVLQRRAQDALGEALGFGADLAPHLFLGLDFREALGDSAIGQGFHSGHGVYLLRLSSQLPRS